MSDFERDRRESEGKSLDNDGCTLLLSKVESVSFLWLVIVRKRRRIAQLRRSLSTEHCVATTKARVLNRRRRCIGGWQTTGCVRYATLEEDDEEGAEEEWEKQGGGRGGEATPNGQVTNGLLKSKNKHNNNNLARG